MAGIKIVDLPAVGRDLAATDLFEMSLAGGTGSRKITGQEIMNASKLSVNNTPVINGTSGRIFFQGSTNVLQQSANLFWDDTNLRLGINGTPTSPLEIFHNPTGINDTIGLTLNSGSTGSTYKAIRFTAGIYGELGTFGVRTNTGEFRWGISSGGYFPTIYANGSERLRINTTGNVLIGTTTDAGFKLDVNGTARTGAFQSTSSIAATTSITAANADGFNLTAGTLRISAQAGPTIGIYTLDQTTYGYNHAITFNSFNGLNTQTSGAATSMVRIRQTFQVASSATSYSCLLVDPTINQTGTANGITRGLFVNPTLTAAADFRAIETTAGNVIFNGGNVGIGTSTPLNTLDVSGTVRLLSGGSYLTLNGATFSELGYSTNNYFRANGSFAIVNGPIIQFLRSGNEVARFAATTGNVLINTTTDAGFRLDVNGTARVNGSELRVGNLQLLTSGSPGTTGQGITTTGRKISLQSQGEINIDNAAAYQFLGYADNPVSMAQNATGRTVSFVQVKGGFSSPNYNNTQGNLLWINPVYNMGGTTNAGQILRGIYYNPTLTDLTNATHYAIHTTSGRVRLEGLPTSPTGLSAGDLWNNGGVINIV
jgi:hypothetical protein